MKRYAMVVLGVLNVVLVFGLLGAWFKPDGSLRNVHWIPPEPMSVDYLGSVPVLPARNAIDMGRVVAMTDRPLFVAGRRPPPPPPPSSATEEAPVDNLSTAKVLGLYAGNGIGGVVLNIAGKNRRLRLQEAVDGWTLKSIEGNAVVFERSGQTRTLQLTRALFKGGASAAAPLPAEFLPAPIQVPPAVPESGAQTPAVNTSPAVAPPSGRRRFGP
jgi:hypothetical protein